MRDLRPCPFCGSTEISKREMGVVACESCGAALWSEDIEDSETVTETWNRRSMPDCVREVMRISDRKHDAWDAVRKYYDE